MYGEEGDKFESLEIGIKKLESRELAEEPCLDLRLWSHSVVLPFVLVVILIEHLVNFCGQLSLSSSVLSGQLVHYPQS